METVSALFPLNGLIVAGSTPLRGLLRSVLSGFGMSQLHDAARSDEALDLVRMLKPDFLVCAQKLAPMDGVVFTRYLRHAEDSPNPYVPVILVMESPDPQRLSEARDAGVTAVVASPIRARSLRNHLVEMVENPRPYIRVGNYFGPDRRIILPPPGLVHPSRRLSDNHA